MFLLVLILPYPPPSVWCVFSLPEQTERDVSVRQRAADLLYAMCDRSNAKQIVAEMLSYLETADYSIREEMVNTATTWQPFIVLKGAVVQMQEL